jgi:hypothetical protein
MFLHSNRGPAYPPERLAADVLRGVQRNQAIIVAPGRARGIWLANRISPRLLERMLARELRWVRGQLATPEA